MKYKVFLVDDEIVIREGIRNCIQWDDTDFTLIGEAADGEMALAMLNDLKPDILITDIRMPFLDGLALTKLIKKSQSWIKIIILSGHDEFSYAQEAISLGVEKYLLKPVSSAELLDCLNNIAKNIELEKQERKDTENLKHRVLTSNDILKEKYLNNIVTGSLDSDTIFEQAKYFNIGIISKAYAVAIVEICCNKEEMLEIEHCKTTIENIALATGGIICFSSSVDSMTIIFKGLDESLIEELSYTFSKNIKFEIERHTNLSLSIGIGGTVFRISSISQSWAEAKRALKYIYSKGRNLIIGAHDILPTKNLSYTNSSDPIVNQLRHADFNDVNSIIEQYSKIVLHNNTANSNIAYYVIYDIVVAIQSLVQEYGGSNIDAFSDQINPKDLQNISKTFESFKQELSQLLYKFIEFKNTKTKSNHEVTVDKAKRYIQRHFGDPNISLNTVASHVCYSPNHFSTIFSQEAGETFIEYLTNIRIARAKTLLASTSMRSAEIAFEIGYNDPHYFSFIFKKTTGRSPREFRATENHELNQ